MIKDRGTIKWTAMMLPEHVKMIKQDWDDYNKVKKPVLDEQELEEINVTLAEAIEFKMEVIISYFEDGYINDYVGLILTINPNSKEIKLKMLHEDTKIFKFEEIVSVKTNE